MPEIDVGVPESEVSDVFPVAPAGVYPCTISSCKAGTSRAEKPKLIFGFTPINPIDCQLEGKVVPVAGKEIFRQSVSLAPNALFTLKGIQKACGGKGWHGGKVTTEEFVGCQVKVQVAVGTDTVKNRTFNTVEDVSAL